MATLPFTRVVLDTRYQTRQIVWSNLLNTDDGAPVENTGPPQTLFVAVSGTFGVGGSVAFQGSADGVTWGTLILVNNSAATFTSATAAAVRGNPRFIRPIVTAGDGATNLTVTVYTAPGFAHD